MQHTVPKQAHAVRARVFAHALIQCLEVKTVFERAVLDERFGRDFLVVVDEAVGEAEIELGVGVLGCGAQHEDVAQAFGLAVFALDAVVVG